MILEKQIKGPISFFTGEFIDENTERDYVNQDIGKAKKYLNPLILFFGILYFLFIIPDYINLQKSPFIALILINRMVVFSLIIILYSKLKKSKSYEFFYKWLTFYNIMIYTSFLVTFVAYGKPNIIIQTFGIMLIVISLFLIPNRWIYTFIISLIFIVVFYFISGYLENALHFNERIASIVFLLIVLIISGISSLRANYNKRVQFIQERKLLKISVTDQLTGCYNRLVLNKELENIYAFNNDNGEACIVLFDFDNFKSINDNYGHLTGDRVLVKTVQLFTSLLNKNDLLVRWGGEEFIVLVKNSSIDDTIALTKKLQETLCEYDFGIGSQVTCSFGVVSSLECSNIDELLTKVDKRLYMAKQMGKNTIISANI